MRSVPRRSSIALLLAVAAAVAAPAVASADEGQIIVKYAAGADAHDRADARDDAGVTRDATLPLPSTELVTPEAGTSVAQAVADLERSGDVAYAEPDQPRHAFATTNDPRLDDQWALRNTGQAFWTSSGWVSGTPGDDIDVVPAWDIATEATPTVAVVDSGVDLQHPDLKANILSGGYDFVGNDTNPTDQNGHGTHVAGTIGAEGNNGIGVTGIAWKAHILPVRVLDSTGSGLVSDAVKGYQYAASHGAKIVNLSLGGDEPSQAEYDAIRTATDTLFVVAAGNSGANVDTTDSYPCAYDLPNVLCVAATDGNDALASFSNYGPKSVDIAAPGVGILSTYPTSKGGYAWMSGSSMATPEVSGAAALVLGQDPTLTPWQIREKLLAGADPVPGLAGKVASGGRLDVFNAMKAAAPPADTAPVSATVAPAARQLSTGTPTSTPAPATPVVTTPVTPATPAPALTTPATPAPAVDRTGPTVSASLSGRGALRLLLAGRLRVSTTASERAALRVELRVDARTAKRLHLTTRAATVTVATGSASLAQAGRTPVTVRAGAKAKRALAKLRSVKVSLRATATDAAGNGRTRSRTLTMTR
jgi:large repetitive protein